MRTWPTPGATCAAACFNVVGKYFDGKVPAVPSKFADAPNPLKDIADSLYEKYDACMADVNFTDAAAAVQELASRVNLYVEESAPWNLAKSEETQGELAYVLYNAAEACAFWRCSSRRSCRTLPRKCSVA